MGSKTAARRLAIAVGRAGRARVQSRELRIFPPQNRLPWKSVIRYCSKAAAGGGGKGMRRVETRTGSGAAMRGRTE